MAERIPEALPSGVCTVFVRHTTAGLIINEAASGLVADVQDWLARLIDDDHAYRHDRIDDDAAAHLHSVVLGADLTVPICDGQLDLGTWQQILLVETDDPRTRSVEVKISEAVV